ncbi:serine O-acetyltransferase [Kaistella pullorum]|uniref:Serine acetyltransferase n=1 Tax=Kaistella pullorum TaxID=2763074 RepID=A0ABR8WJD6_9FLAO|nr:serine acetyltransferase [Kaistella pullorum]MBD8017022.1 serine acetyltransferase [Kaistella pullorum]
MSNAIIHDLYRYGKLTSLWHGFKLPGFAFKFLWKKAKETTNPIFRFIYRFILWLSSYRFGFQIPLKTEIGHGFLIGRFGYVVINGNCVIGNFCNIGHGVTLGQISNGYKKGAPKLSERVWVGTGAVIVGGIRIGKNVLVAPNAYVNFDVPDDSVVIGNPAKIIHKTDATNAYINNILAI